MNHAIATTETAAMFRIGISSVIEVLVATLDITVGDAWEERRE